MWIRALVASWAVGGVLGSAEQGHCAAAQLGGSARPSAELQGSSARPCLHAAPARTLWALCGTPGNDVAPLVAERGQPLHVLGGLRGELVLVWGNGPSSSLAWFDGN